MAWRQRFSKPEQNIGCGLTADSFAAPDHCFSYTPLFFNAIYLSLRIMDYFSSTNFSKSAMTTSPFTFSVSSSRGIAKSRASACIHLRYIL